MKVKIIVNSLSLDSGEIGENRCEVWSGEMDILDRSLYIAKISLIGDDAQAHPIVDIPFSKLLGWWEWHPPITEGTEEYELAVDRVDSGIHPSPNPDAPPPQEKT